MAAPASPPALRVYPRDPGSPVYQHYWHMNTRQTLEYVVSKEREMASRQRFPLTMPEALAQLDNYVDPSDPDVHAGNLLHAYSTADHIRFSRDLPEDAKEWFTVLGLIHDVGKILFTDRFNGGKGEPSWSVVGDTFPVGCAFSDRCVYANFFVHNPDFDVYDTLGIYPRGCGLDRLKMSFGHDEFLYSVLIANRNHRFPDLGARIIRYHSFYPLHTAGAYTEFLSPEDRPLLEWVRRFQKHDLYSKNPNDTPFVLTDTIRRYYDDLLLKFFPEPLEW